MRAVILAGGKGTRLRPLTDRRPKPLVPFMGAPFASGLLRRLQAAGCQEATFLVGADAEPFTPLRGLGEDLGMRVDVVTEERPLDTAGAARRLLAPGGDTALVCNGDILTDLDFAALVAAHRNAGAAATLALTRVDDTSAFGVVVCDDAGRVERFVEKPAPGTEEASTVNAGTYVLEPEAFAPFPGDGPLSFERAVFPGLLEAGATLTGVPSDGYWADLGTPRRYLDGHAAVLTGRCAWPLPHGLVLRDGQLAVHTGARVDPQARVGPLAVVDAGCEIGAGAHVSDTVLHAGAVIEPGARVQGAVVGQGARVGRDAVLEPGAVLGDGASVADGGRVDGTVTATPR